MKVGIIGCGRVAQTRHIPEYGAHPGARIAGYYDFNEERARELAAVYGGNVYDSADAMLADRGIDAVSICTANHTHAEIAIKALRSGKHVLCEKPMAVSLEECKAMVHAAAENNRQLMIGQNQRFARAHVRAKELLLEDVIGTVLTFKTTFGHGGPETWSIDKGSNSWFFDKGKAAMGAMADLGIHKTDLIQFLLGQKVVAVTAQMLTLDKRNESGELISVDDNAICIYEMEDGAIGTMTASWTYYGREDNSTVLYGTKGIMKIYDDPDHSISVVLKNGEQILYDIDKIQTNDNQTKSGIIDAFVDALEAGTEVPVSGADVLSAMEAVFACQESSREKRRIVIREKGERT
jgi:predicted dehydrogenase